MRTGLAASRSLRKYTTDTGRTKASGAVLPYVILTTLMIFIGVVLLATRNSESNLSSARQSDYNTAREAAEFGMAQTISAMNSASRGYLWVTKLANWSTITTSELDDCMIKHSGFQSGSTLLGKKTLPGIGTASYELTNFLEPQVYVTRSTCNKFGNLIGGSATITITGRVERTANSPAATYQLSRRIHVIGPTVGGLGEFPLIILGKNSDIGNADDGFIQADSPYTIDTKYDLGIACLQSTNCFASSSATPKKTNVANIGSLPMPGYPSPPTWTGELATLKSITTNGINDEFKDFPYKEANPSEVDDRYCTKTTNQIYTNGTEEITCRINNLNIIQPSNGQAGIFKIRTNPYPVNIYLEGNITAAAKSYLGAKEVIDDVDATAWSDLRILGKNSGDINNCNTQTLTAADVGLLRGAFAWIPYGTANYTTGGGGGNLATNFGILWACKFLGPTSSNSYYGARLDSPDGLGDIFGPAFSGISDQSAVTGIPASPHYYRGYGTSE